MYIFTDSSVNQQSNKAIGSYLILNNLDNGNYTDIKFIEFDSRSSTIAEFITIQHVFKYVESSFNQVYGNYSVVPPIYLYTDCENFVNLVTVRKDKIKNTNKNYELYKYLIDTVHKYNIEVIWTHGHSKGELKTENYEVIFSLVDKHARKTLRDLVKC